MSDNIVHKDGSSAELLAARCHSTDSKEWLLTLAAISEETIRGGIQMHMDTLAIDEDVTEVGRMLLTLPEHRVKGREYIKEAMKNE